MHRRDAMTPAELTRLRESLGLTIAQLAEELGVDQSTVWRWEAGESQIRRQHVRHLLLFADSRTAATA